MDVGFVKFGNGVMMTREQKLCITVKLKNC